jgi:hypothetical protein
MTGRAPIGYGLAFRSPSRLGACVQRCLRAVFGGGCLVREEAAVALVADAALALSARGYDPVITSENSVRLVRLGALMWDAFGIGPARDTTEEDT